MMNILRIIAISIGTIIVFATLAGCMGPDVEFVPTTIDIFNAKISEVTTSTAVISWQTTHSAFSRVQIVRQEDVSNTILDTEMRRSHRVELEGLDKGTFYLLIIQSANGRGAGSFETGQELIFQTSSE